MRQYLDGNWELFAIPSSERFTSPEKLTEFTPITGKVPGNIELDLWHAGLGDDPMVGLNAQKYWEYEYHDFWYRKTVSCDFTGSADLVLEGVDLFAEIFFNGEKIGSCENAFIPQTFKVECRKENTLAIRIISAEIEARKYPDTPGTLSHAPEVYSSVYTRRAAHATGWDILPRLSLGGLWKSVYLEKPDSLFAFDSLWVQTRRLDREKNLAVLRLFYHFSCGEESLAGCSLKIRMSCGDSVWERHTPARFTSGIINFELHDPKLWYPRYYGKAELYELSAVLYSADQKELCSISTTCGIRTLELEHTPDNLDGKGKFCFIYGI